MQAVILLIAFVAFVFAQDTTNVTFNVTGTFTSCSILTFSWTTVPHSSADTPFNISIYRIGDTQPIGDFSSHLDESGSCTWHANIPAGNYSVLGMAAADANLVFAPQTILIKANQSCSPTSTSSAPSQSAEGDSTPTSSPSTVPNRRDSLSGGDVAGIVLGVVIVLGFVVAGIALRRHRVRPASKDFKELESQTNSTVSHERPASRSALRAISPLPQLLSLPSNRPPIPHTEMNPEKLQQVLRQMK